MTPKLRLPLLLGLVALIAAVNFLWQLGSSSLHIDEGFSWWAAEPDLGELLHRVRVNEVAPWTYYLGLHGWTELLGSDSEWLLRLPSALAAVAIVLVTYRIGVLTLRNRAAALLAATLAATSPLLLTYAQQARAFALAALFVMLAVWAALEAERDDEARSRRAWLLLLGGSSIAALWLHYTAALVLVPLYAWVLLSSRLGRGETLAAVGAVGLASLPLLPLADDQLSRGHEAGVAPSARLTAENALQVLGSPFDGRAEQLTFWLVLGAIATAVAALIVGLQRRGAPAEPLRGLLLPLALGPVLVVLALTAVGDDVLISRYTVVAAPFLVLLIAGAVAVGPRLVAAPLAVLALAGAIGGSLYLHRSASFYGDVGGAFTAIESRYREGDIVVLRGYPAIGPVGEYYRRRELPDAGLVVIPGSQGLLDQLVRERRRLWVIDQQRLRPRLRRGLVPEGYRSGARWELDGTVDLQVTSAFPRPLAGLGGAG